MLSTALVVRLPGDIVRTYGHPPIAIVHKRVAKPGPRIKLLSINTKHHTVHDCIDQLHDSDVYSYWKLLSNNTSVGDHIRYAGGISYWLSTEAAVLENTPVLLGGR